MYYIIEDEYGHHWMLDRENPGEQYYIPHDVYIWLYSDQALRERGLR